MRALGESLAVVLLSYVLVSCSREETPESTPPKTPVATVYASVETEAVQDSDDAADDPAIWINPADPAESVIFGTNKRRGIGVYGLDGSELYFRDDGRINNVDVRQGVTLGGRTLDVVAATNRTDKTIVVYEFAPNSMTLSPLFTPIETGFGDPYGLCMYLSPEDGSLYVFATEADTGYVGQWKLSISENDEATAERMDRTLRVGSQAEGCAADDEQKLLFVAEENVGLYAYWAEPGLPEGRRQARFIIDQVDGGNLTADAEGVAVVREGEEGAGYIIVSSQGSNSYNVYDRAPPYEFRGAFVIADNEDIDGVEETDGIDVTAANLGPAFPGGVFVAQDGFNYEEPDGKLANQNFKLVPWPAIRSALSLPEPVVGEGAELGREESDEEPLN